MYRNTRGLRKVEGDNGSLLKERWLFALVEGRYKESNSMLRGVADRYNFYGVLVKEAIALGFLEDAIGEKFLEGEMYPPKFLLQLANPRGDGRGVKIVKMDYWTRRMRDRRWGVGYEPASYLVSTLEFVDVFDQIKQELNQSDEDIVTTFIRTVEKLGKDSYLFNHFHLCLLMEYGLSFKGLAYFLNLLV